MAHENGKFTLSVFSHIVCITIEVLGLDRSDIVLFFDILYHIYNFMNGFALAKSLANMGGVDISERICMITDSFDAIFNAEDFD